MIERASSAVCCGDQRLVGNRHDLAVNLDRRREIGGNEQVGAVLLRHQAQEVVHEFQCLIAFHSFVPYERLFRLSLAREGVLVGGLATGLGSRNNIAPYQFEQILVKRLHAELRTGLDRRIHLRDLVFTDQVTDRRGADHDFMRSSTTQRHPWS